VERDSRCDVFGALLALGAQGAEEPGLAATGADAGRSGECGSNPKAGGTSVVSRGLGRLGPVDRQTTAGAVASELQARTVDGTFAPGSRLGKMQLATRLGAVRGSVREALQRLVQEGLLENRRSHGVFVSVLDDRATWRTSTWPGGRRSGRRPGHY
jgi:hypothetical protein